MSFAELGVPEAVIAALGRHGVTTPFPIQAATLRSSLARRDVLGRGRTGSGKTVAFAVPAVAALAESGRSRQQRRPRSLIVVPTRELAAQVAAVVAPLAQAMGLRITTVYGGVAQGPQVSALRQGIDILVACPGRLEDLIGQGHCRLDAVEVTVLDEADHLADLGFVPAVKRLLDQTPAGGQRLLFSATLDRGVDDLVRRYLHDPVTHSVDTVDASPPMLEHHTFTVEPDHKAAVVRELASGIGRSLLFTRTKHAARKLARQLVVQGIPAVDLHGNLSQPQRARNLAAFADGSARVLVATDIAARGIHVDDIALVVHVDPPAEAKAYLHRSGRTARAGAAGVVVTVMTPAQVGDVRSLVRQAGISPTVARVGPGDPRTAALTGPAADLSFLAPPQPARRGPKPSGSAPGRGRSDRRPRAAASVPQARRSGASARASGPG
ncbi:MAG: DEAD/DEAH box helicase, partial [Actinomycetota bacterium]|nr:DEAD/DEAH box helicase [Actinomycetota bacterium]